MNHLPNVTLRPGELVLWQGQAKQFGVLSGPDGRAILRQWLIGAGMLAAILTLYVTSTRYRETAPIVFLAGAMAVLLVVPFWERSRILRQRYYITNERAIVVAGGRHVTSMERGAIDEYRLSGENGSESLVLGSALHDEPNAELRHLGLYPTVHREPDSKPVISGMVFYHIENAKAAELALK